MNGRKHYHKKTYGNDIIITVIDLINSFKKEDWKPLETFWIRQYKAWGFDLENKNNGGSGSEGFVTDYKEYYKEYNKSNKQKEYFKKYQREHQRKYQKEYREQNKEHKKQYNKEYRNKIK